jgi:crossover junction endodeoxyribonuclease RuvC
VTTEGSWHEQAQRKFTGKRINSVDIAAHGTDRGGSLNIIGIDPGISGAIVVLQSRSVPYPIEWMRMPTLKVGKSSRVDCAALRSFLANYDVGHAYVESVHAMPGQGVASMFTFGHACGAVDGLLAALHIPMTLVTPQAWKKYAGLIGKDKDAARSRAVQMWPGWDALRKKGEGQAFADAALIARFGEQA